MIDITERPRNAVVSSFCQFVGLSMESNRSAAGGSSGPNSKSLKESCHTSKPNGSSMTRSRTVIRPLATVRASASHSSVISRFDSHCWRMISQSSAGTIRPSTGGGRSPSGGSTSARVGLPAGRSEDGGRVGKVGSNSGLTGTGRSTRCGSTGTIGAMLPAAGGRVGGVASGSTEGNALAGTVAVSTGISAGALWPGQPTTGIGSGPEATRGAVGTGIDIGTIATGASCCLAIASIRACVARF